MRSSLAHSAICWILSFPLALSFTSDDTARSGERPRVSVTTVSSANDQDVATTSFDQDSPSLSNTELLWYQLSTTPSNQATPRDLTQDILSQVRKVEQSCGTPDDEVVSKLSGTWELVWTAQDNSSQEANRGLSSWINPLENQSYSNNNDNNRNKNSRGRSNPLLPRDIQDRLESLGLLESIPSQKEGSLQNPLLAPKSTQSIDLKNNLATNVVSLQTPRFRAVLTVLIHLTPNTNDPRRVDVQFETCQVTLPGKINLSIPLGPLHVRGWLRTTYIDNDFRITRGHKGSVFILARPTVARRKGLGGTP